MPLKKGKSKAVVSANISELMNKPGKTRSKAVKTIAEKTGLPAKEAQRRQAVAIALSTAGVTPKKSKK